MDYLPRIGDAELTRLLSTSPIVMLDGARATGKTTSAVRVAASELRLPRDLAMLQSDPVAVLRNLKKPALVDEWQLAGVDLLWALKEIVDDDPTPGSFILTGSVEPESLGPTYPLAGRAARLVWRPMSVREIAGAGGAQLWIDRLANGDLYTPSNTADPTAIDLLTRSGFPAVRTLGDPRPALHAYADSIAQRSIEERRDAVGVGRLLRVLAELECLVVPEERVWRAADINRATCVSYQAMLQRTHVVQPSNAWLTNRLKRMTAMSKRYFADTALALAVAGISAEQLRLDPTIAGRYFDSFIACQLRPEIDAKRATMHHMRSKGGEHEIDIVIESAGKIFAFEVKAGVRPVPADAKHLQWLQSEISDSLIAAAVIHRGASTWELVPGIWALPASSIWS